MDKYIGYLFIAPNYIGVIVFMLIPFLFSLGLVFSEWNHLKGLAEMEFVGFDNIRKIFDDGWFRISLTNNIIYAFLSVPISVFLALILAVILNDKVYGKSIIRVAYFMPYITNGIAIGFVWMLLFQPTTGPINMVLSSIGIENPPQWLGSTTWALPALIIINIWATVGFNVVIYLANLQNISKEIFESVKMDGASGLKVLRDIIFPLLTPATFFLVSTGIILSFKVFGIVAALTQGGPVRSTYVLGYYIYTTAFTNYDMGYASAISWVLFIFVFVITLIQWQLQKHWVYS